MMFPDLRPDLRGLVITLHHTDTWALKPGERARVRVEAVRGAGEDDPDLVIVEGWWIHTGVTEQRVRVEVRGSRLPQPQGAH